MSSETTDRTSRPHRWALITGASSGIGLEFAKLFAADGWHLVLVARREEKLRELASELKAKHGVESKIVTADLSKVSVSQQILSACSDIEISALINNAGFGYRAPFVE